MEDNTRIFGIRPVIEALQSEKTINKIYIQKGLSGPLFQELNALLKKTHYPIAYVPVEKLNKMAKGNHQGVVATISPVRLKSIEETVEEVLATKNKPLFLLLDQITDARNFGAIIRTAECTGVDAIIFPGKGAAPVNADTIKTSAGGVFRVPLCQVSHIRDAVFYLQASGIILVAATEKTDQQIYDIDLTGPTAIVMGSEAKGVSGSILNSVDHKAKLPMYGSIGSLNVSVACGAILYEAVRQRL